MSKITHFQIVPSLVKLLTDLELFFADAFDLFDLILYVPSTIFQLNRDGSSWVEPGEY